MAAPTNLEQLYLELINSARLNPQQDAARYVTSYGPLTSNDADIQNALDFFHVNGSALQAAFDALTPVQPLAWNDALGSAARTHSQLMVNANTQSHDLPGEQSLTNRTAAAGYSSPGFSLGENIFAFADSATYGHAGFMVDWGNVPPNGMQSPPGHRNNIMNSTFREVGIGVIEVATSSPNVGPQVVTQDFGWRSNGPSVLILGVTYTDTDANNFYSVGEGRSGMSIVASSGGSTQSTSSGGYTLGLAAGSHVLTFTGGLLSSAATFTSTFSSGTNAKIDIIGGTTLKTSTGGLISGPFSRIEVLGTAGLTLTGDNDTEAIVGGAGGDTLNGAGGNDVLTGNAGNDTLSGGEGADTLDGGTGNDAMSGGSGNDTFFVAEIGDSATENASEGTDTVISSVSFTLAANVENLSLTGTADLDGAGNTSTNVLTGNSGHNVLTGSGGDDTLIGGGGYDTAQFSGNASQYAFVQYQTALYVMDRLAGRDGIDATAQVEQARFLGDNVTAVFTASDVFTPLEYIASYIDLMDGFGANAQLGYDHFANTGRIALRSASFDGLEYLASHPDLLAGIGLDADAAATHYIQSGRNEGRTVSFNGLEYLASYTDLINSFGVNEDLGTTHYLTAGRNEGRTVSFRGLEYLASNPDLMAGFGDNFELATIHYISSGRFEGRVSSFHALEYIASYADLIQGIGVNVNAGALHYINSGRNEGRTEHFDAAQYLANYPDLAAGFGGSHELAAIHYIQSGFHEGRTDQVIPG